MTNTILIREKLKKLDKQIKKVQDDYVLFDKTIDNYKNYLVNFITTHK